MAIPMVGASDGRNPHLRLVGGEAADGDDELATEVRSVRRDMARLLRGMQASGHGVAGWPHDVITRLAHVDTVTARYLMAPTAENAAVRECAAAMRALEGWVLRRLSPAVRGEVRAFELMIRIEDDELEFPLLYPDGAPEEQTPTITVVGASVAPRSLRAGLRSLGDPELRAVCRRLGVRPLELENAAEGAMRDREAMEIEIRRTLRDDHLLGILLATLARGTHEVLACLLRGRSVRSSMQVSWARAAAGGAAGSEEAEETALAELRACGLVFGATAEAPWVPVELQHRVDGVLRAFGI